MFLINVGVYFTDKGKHDSIYFWNTITFELLDVLYPKFRICAPWRYKFRMQMYAFHLAPNQQIPLPIPPDLQTAPKLEIRSSKKEQEMLKPTWLNKWMRALTALAI